jgi:hypothetical protein
LVLPESALNGGFPEPPHDGAVRVVDAHHEACGASTRVRLPGSLPTRAVRRFHCAGCAAAFEAAHVEEIEVRMAGDAVLAPEPPPPLPPAPPTEVKSAQPMAMEERAVEALTRAPKRRAVPKLPALSLPKVDPESRSWKLISILAAAVLVVVVLVVLRGGNNQPALPAAAPSSQAHHPSSPAAPAAAAAADQSASKPTKNTKFVQESSFSLAMPSGWQKIDPPAGATFAAVAADGGADATLWITQDPKLDFPTFVSQSLTQLKTLAGSAGIVERVAAPTAEGTIVRLAADAPEGQPTYNVTLRVAGPYRYYLATTVQPDATAEASDGVDLITGSFTPELGQ